MSETTTRAYELGYLLVPTAAETEVPGLVDTLKGFIGKGGGEVVSEGAPEFIDLAYTMEKSIASKKYKYSQGYFGWVKFTAEPDAMEAIKKALDAQLELVRYILVKTSVENTIVFKKPKVEARREATGGDEEIVVEESEVDELKEDHELLPDVAADATAVQAEDPTEEAKEKEE